MGRLDGRREGAVGLLRFSWICNDRSSHCLGNLLLRLSGDGRQELGCWGNAHCSGVASRGSSISLSSLGLSSSGSLLSSGLFLSCLLLTGRRNLLLGLD